MNHQTYEQWALHPETCSPNDLKALQTHLAECESCKTLSHNWQQVECLILNAPVLQPAPGFSARFQASLEKRKAEEHRRQLRRFLLIMGISLTSLLIIGSAYFYINTPPEFIFRQFLALGTDLLVFWTNVRVILNTLFSFAPVALFIPVIMIAASALGGLTILWLTTIWKFALQGEKAS